MDLEIDSTYWATLSESDNFAMFKKVEAVIVPNEADSFLQLFEKMRKKGFKLISTMPNNAYLFERTVSSGCK